MNTKALKVGLTAIVLVAAFAGLLWSTLREGTEYYKHVDEVMVQPPDWYGKKLQTHAFAGPRFVHPARHVQRRCGSGVEGRADAAGLRGRVQRRDGEVPVEVRTEAG